MIETINEIILSLCSSFRNKRECLMDILTAVQNQFGFINDDAIDYIAEYVKCPRVEVEGVVSFYSFFSKEYKGKTIIRLCCDPVCKMKGYDEVAASFKEAISESDNNISLEQTPCIGMSDQEPAALINYTVFTKLTPDKAKSIVLSLKENPDPSKIKQELGDGNNASEYIMAAVKNNIRKKGSILFAEHKKESGLKNVLSLSCDQIINEIKESNLRGRGGAGFPTGLKWKFTRSALSNKKVVICNADEGEPGTFKDRVLLTEYSNLLFEGMTIAGFAIGASSGIVYLRGEYTYLKNYLENVLEQRRKDNLLGESILGKVGLDFDIRIQMGAGAYICGEETALISSCEGQRGEPKTRPPFPAQKGYLGMPTCVNNVETFCCVARIMQMGAAAFSRVGTINSTGTKLLSISGDCQAPGVYEYDFGIKIKDILSDADAEDTKAVLVGGPSGQFISREDFNRTICYSDLATGGSFVIFNSTRNIVKIVLEYLDFFAEESCGYCLPCRAGNVLLKNTLENILEGKGEVEDLEYLEKLGKTIKFSSRCGLGQTSPNPVLTSIAKFRSDYLDLIKDSKGTMRNSFDIKEALRDAEMIADRQSEIFG